MTELMVSAAAIIFATAATLTFLHRRLLSLLIELCGLEQRARFWWRVSATELVVGTGLSTSLAVLFQGPAPPWSVAAAVMRGGLGGLLLSLGTITAGTLVVGQGTRTPAEKPPR